MSFDCFHWSCRRDTALMCRFHSTLLVFASVCKTARSPAAFLLYATTCCYFVSFHCAGCWRKASPLTCVPAAAAADATSPPGNRQVHLAVSQGARELPAVHRQGRHARAHRVLLHCTAAALRVADRVGAHQRPVRLAHAPAQGPPVTIWAGCNGTSRSCRHR